MYHKFLKTLMISSYFFALQQEPSNAIKFESTSGTIELTDITWGFVLTPWVWSWYSPFGFVDDKDREQCFSACQLVKNLNVQSGEMKTVEISQDNEKELQDTIDTS